MTIYTISENFSVIKDYSGKDGLDANHKSLELDTIESTKALSFRSVSAINTYLTNNNYNYKYILENSLETLEMRDFYSFSILYEIKDSDDSPEHKVARVCLFKDRRLFPLLIEVNDALNSLTCLDVLKEVLKNVSVALNPSIINSQDPYDKILDEIKTDYFRTFGVEIPKPNPYDQFEHTVADYNESMEAQVYQKNEDKREKMIEQEKERQKAKKLENQPQTIQSEVRLLKINHNVSPDNYYQVDKFKINESTLDPNVKRLMGKKIHKFKNETVDEVLKNLNIKLNSDTPEYQKLLTKIKLLDTKVTNMNPQIQFTLNEDKDLKSKIDNLKQTLNSMNSTFDNSFSKNFQVGLKRRLLELQIKLIETKYDSSDSVELGDFGQSKISTRIIDVAKRINDAEKLYGDSSYKINDIENRQQNLNDDLSNQENKFSIDSKLKNAYNNDYSVFKKNQQYSHLKDGINDNFRIKKDSMKFRQIQNLNKYSYKGEPEISSKKTPYEMSNFRHLNNLRKDLNHFKINNKANYKKKYNININKNKTISHINHKSSNKNTRYISKNHKRLSIFSNGFFSRKRKNMNLNRLKLKKKKPKTKRNALDDKISRSLRSEFSAQELDDMGMNIFGANLRKKD